MHARAAFSISERRRATCARASSEPLSPTGCCVCIPFFPPSFSCVPYILIVLSSFFVRHPPLLLLLLRLYDDARSDRHAPIPMSFFFIFFFDANPRIFMSETIKVDARKNCCVGLPRSAMCLYLIKSCWMSHRTDRERVATIKAKLGKGEGGAPRRSPFS